MTVEALTSVASLVITLGGIIVIGVTRISKLEAYQREQKHRLSQIEERLDKIEATQKETNAVITQVSVELSKLNAMYENSQKVVDRHDAYFDELYKKQ